MLSEHIQTLDNLNLILFNFLNFHLNIQVNVNKITTRQILATG